MADEEHRRDVAVSFAGEDRPLARSIADTVKPGDMKFSSVSTKRQTYGAPSWLSLLRACTGADWSCLVA